MAIYLVSIARGWVQRVTVVWLSLDCIGVVGFSRLYPGVHHLSDALAAMAVGAFWLALCATAVHTLSSSRQARDSSRRAPDTITATNRQEGTTPR